MKINTTTTPTLTEWPVPFFSVSGVGPFCEANPHRMAIAISFLFLASCHSVRAGVPFFTKRQPSQNGRCHFLFPVSGVVPFWRVGVPFFTGRQPSHNGHCHFFPDSVASRFSRDASPHRMARAFFHCFRRRAVL